jgi:hypothetical protein
MKERERERERERETSREKNASGFYVKMWQNSRVSEICIRVRQYLDERFKFNDNMWKQL